MNKTELQQHITRRSQRDTALTNEWLKNRGISEEDLLNSQSLLLQAQKTAHELLQHHAALLKRQKHEWLADFGKRSRNTRQRQRITNQECYAVLNYAKSINRQLFKQHRQTSV